MRGGTRAVRRGVGPWLCQKVADSLAGQEERGLPVSSDSIKTLSTYTVQYTPDVKGAVKQDLFFKKNV